MSESTDLIELLNDLLCDLAVFYQKVRNYHWNVRGPLFFELHAKFEQLYLEVAENVDQVAERILGLGSTPRSTLADFLEYSSLEEDLEPPKALQMVSNLRTDFGIILDSLSRLRIVADEDEDDTTINIIDAIQESYEKHDWMFSAFLAEE